jgi:hypothetical protein
LRQHRYRVLAAGGAWGACPLLGAPAGVTGHMSVTQATDPVKSSVGGSPPCGVRAGQAARRSQGRAFLSDSARFRMTEAARSEALHVVACNVLAHSGIWWAGARSGARLESPVTVGRRRRHGETRNGAAPWRPRRRSGGSCPVSLTGSPASRCQRRARARTDGAQTTHSRLDGRGRSVIVRRSSCRPRGVPPRAKSGPRVAVGRQLATAPGGDGLEEAFRSSSGGRGVRHDHDCRALARACGGCGNGACRHYDLSSDAHRCHVRARERGVRHRDRDLAGRADRDNEGEGLFLLEVGTSRPFTLAVNLGAKTHVSRIFSFTATGTSLRACLLQTSQGGGEENIGTVWANVTK